MNADAVTERNNVRVLGRADGPVLLFVQGFGCDQVIWDRILPAFTDTYKVVLFDHVGTGGADPDAYNHVKYASFEGFLADLIEIIEVLDLDNATVLGHSIAGTMALAAATRTSRIARLVLLCVSPCYVNDEGYSGGLPPEDIEGVLDTVEANYPLWARAMAPEIAGTEPGSVVSEELAENMCRLRPEYVRDFLEMSFAADVRQLLPQVPVPALILQSRGDPLTPEPAPLFLQSHLPQSRRVDLNACGNMPHLSSPRETAEAIREYLEAGACA